MTLSLIFVSAWAAAALVMFVLWVLQVMTKNAGTVDVAWAFLTPLVAAWLILADGIANATRQWLIIGMAIFWGFRLGVYLFRRVTNEVEDGRYRYMREYCGKHAQWVFFVFFQVQATWTLLFALPFWAASRNTTSDLGLPDVLGILIWCVAIAGESISDRQLHRFRMDSRNKGQVCNVGLWRYSRHPNYFFEWLQWWCFVLMGYGSDYWWLTWVGLVVVYVFLNYITGVPYTEQQSLRSRGDAYRDYQQTTSRFFPLPRRTGVSRNTGNQAKDSR